jgi:hypothetical protein
MMTLGPFSYSMMAFSLLLIGPEDWAWAARLLRRKRRTLVLYDPTRAVQQQLARVLARLDVRRALEFGDGRATDAPAAAVHLTGPAGASAAVAALPLGVLYAWPLRIPPLRGFVEGLLSNAESKRDLPEEALVATPAAQFTRRVVRALGEALAVGFFAVIVTQVGVDNWAIPDRYRVKYRPEFQRQLVEYLRVPQGWSMFSPDAPKEDGTVTIDAVLSDGRHIDPRKQRPPDFEPALHGPWFDDQQWCDWDLRMRFDGNRHLHPHFRDYIERLDKFSSWKQRATIVYFDVYWVNNAAPPPGSTRPYNFTKQLLFSGGVHP